MTNNFDKLTQEIDNLLKNKRSIIIAISGFGGSGKTTLCEDINSHFSNSAKLQLDNFLTNRGQGDGWQDGYDWNRFESVLKDARAGNDLHYQWYNWEKDETKEWINQPKSSLLIVEGVRIFQPNLKKYFDLTIWIDKSLEDSTKQGKKRDKNNKNKEDYDIEAHLNKWDELWVPKEVEFMEKFNPKNGADILYKPTHRTN